MNVVAYTSFLEVLSFFRTTGNCIITETQITVEANNNDWTFMHPFTHDLKSNPFMFIVPSYTVSRSYFNVKLHRIVPVSKFRYYARNLSDIFIISQKIAVNSMQCIGHFMWHFIWHIYRNLFHDLVCTHFMLPMTFPIILLSGFIVIENRCGGLGHARTLDCRRCYSLYFHRGYARRKP